MRATLLAILLATASMPALALDVPAPGKADPHIRETAYNPLDRVQIVGQIGRSTSITFGTDEKIVRVIFGATQDPPWEGIDGSKGGSLANTLPLWPVNVGTSNMQVTTRLPSGDERVYQFAMIVHAAPDNGQDDPDATFGLIFTYPAQAKAAAVAAWQEKRAAAKQQAALARLKTDVFYGQRNWRYVAQGKDRDLAPTEVSDNTQVTALRFPGNSAVPAVYIVDPDGKERLVPFDMQDDLVVLHTTAPHFRLRLGDRVLDLFNLGYDPVGMNPGTGTTSPDVIRKVVVTQ